MRHKRIKTFYVKYEPISSIFLRKQENSRYNLARRGIHFDKNSFLEQFMYILVNHIIYAP